MMDRRTFLASALAATAFGAAHAQSFPSKPIKFVCPFPPGAGSDAISRQVTDRMARNLGQPFVVENRAGAAGNIGLEYLSKQPADGYTIGLLSTSTAILNPLIYKSLPYNAERDFVPIGLISSLPYVLVVNTSVPAQNLRELIALAKAQPGRLSFATPGKGHASHLGGELLKQRAGIDLIHVPYQGSGPATTGLIGGQTTMMFALLSDALPLLKAGRLRAIAIPTKERSPLVPDLPTFGEAGLGDFDMTAWFGVVGLAGTPEPVLSRLNAALNAAVQDPEMRKWLDGLGQQPLGGSAGDFAKLMQQERNRWGPVVRSSGILLG
jgi:tripartite-type tricarboxylate transporter receptor subunit TctC